MRRRQLLESPANTHSGPIASSPLFSQAACERVGEHIRLRSDTIDLIVAAQSRALHFISCVMEKKITQSASKYSPNFPPKNGEEQLENCSNSGRAAAQNV